MSEELRLKVGEPAIISAELFNARQAEIERRENLSATPPIQIVQTRYGRHISIAESSPKIWAKLSGSANPYDFTQVTFDGESWVDLEGGYSGEGNLYEVNDQIDLDGKVLRIRPGAPGEWLAQYIAPPRDSGGHGGACPRFRVVTLDMKGNPYPGIPVDIIGSDGEIAVSGATDEAGIFDWEGFGIYAVAHTPDGRCACPEDVIEYEAESETCIATFLVCKAVTKVTVENEGTLTTQGHVCSECVEPINCKIEGSTYTFTDYGIYAASGRYRCGGPQGRYAIACSHEDLWGGCRDDIIGKCGETKEFNVVTFPKDKYVHNVSGICSNDRSLVIPKKLCMTVVGPEEMLGSHSGEPVTVNWDSNSWDGDPCTYDKFDPVKHARMDFNACEDAGGAYGMCGKRYPPNGLDSYFLMADLSKVEYGSSQFHVTFHRVDDGGPNWGCEASYRVFWGSSCQVPDPPPTCTKAGLTYYADTAAYCPFDNCFKFIFGPTGYVKTIVPCYLHVYPSYIISFYQGWTGTSADLGKFTGDGPIDLHADTLGSCRDGDFQGLTTCCEPNETKSSVTIDECEEYFYMYSRSLMIAAGDWLAGSGFRPYRPPEPSGRVRVGIVSPSCYLGGAERWISDLLDHCDSTLIEWSGIAIQGAPDVPEIPSVRDDWEAHAPVGAGLGAIATLARESDVLIVWGIQYGVIGRIARPGLRIIQVSHSALDLDWVHAMAGHPAAEVIAVSPAAIRGVEPSRRQDAEIILNAVDPDRVAPRRSREAVRAELGIPAGARVAGWLGRIAEEKRPERFVDAVALLPSEWIGVMAGAGLHRAATEAYANRVAPGRILFAGPRDDVGDMLAAFDTFVTPSRSEACSLAIAEAWIAPGGLPTISTPVGLLEDHPDFARILPMRPSGADIATAILADDADPDGTRARVIRAREFASRHLSFSRFGTQWTEAIIRASLTGSRQLADCGDGVWIGSRLGCDEFSSRFDRVIHVWRGKRSGDVCAHVASNAGGENHMEIAWDEFGPVDSLSPGLDAVAEFARIPGRLLIHCSGGVTRSPALALAAKIARGCDPERAESDIRLAMIRDRKMAVRWIAEATQEIFVSMAPGHTFHVESTDILRSQESEIRGTRDGRSPGLMAKMLSFGKAVAAHVADGGREAPQDVRKAREATCRACPLFDPVKVRCRDCGCSRMDLKWKWASSSCPLDPPKWGPWDPR